MTHVDANGGGRVLLVDDEPGVCLMMGDALLPQGYTCESCSSGEDALERLRREGFDVVITDLYMRGISGMTVLKEGLKVRPESAFLVATGEGDARLGVEAMKQGAADYLVKPLHLPSLLASVRKACLKKAQERRARTRSQHYQQLAAKRSSQLKNALASMGNHQDATIEALGALLSFRDHEMAGHAHRVSLYTLELAKRMGVSRKLWKDLARGAFLHDVGKIGIPDEILLKPGRLTSAEMDVVRTHATIGYQLLRRFEQLGAAAEMVRSHHERYDGAGYPRGLKAEEIPLGARIFAVADTLDAMITDRPYRQALPVERAYAEVRAAAGSQFDPKVVQAFLTASPRVWEAIRENVQAIQGAMRADWWNSGVILRMSESIGNLLSTEDNGDGARQVA
ncbi:MAG: HD domain-containing phosphohydrolase [Terriglobia bacterium]